MDWALAAKLIVEVGFPAALAIVEQWEKKGAVTLDEFLKIRDLAQQSAQDRMRLALLNAGVALDSETGKRLLALTH